ncbi:MAG TPA: ECF transporter S component [Bacilli bacterium]|nr:ECF transporter S component [Bacilli bacterium]HPV69460.1 ECF transporter S component [Bacilli bacterium]HPY38008.1 ECF transporter S component [Bacilli bacterium]
MRNKRIMRIVFDAMFLAIIAVMTFVPYVGYIQIGLISFTLIHLPVLIGAALFGWKRGLMYGIFFGLGSLIKATTYPGTIDFLFVNPLISVLPRAVFGLVAGLAFSLARKLPKIYLKGGFIAVLSFLLTALHTFLVLTMLVIVYRPELEVFLNSSVTWVGLALGGLITTGALIEAAIAAIITPTVVLLIINKYRNSDYLLLSKKEIKDE